MTINNEINTEQLLALAENDNLIYEVLKIIASKPSMKIKSLIPRLWEITLWLKDCKSAEAEWMNPKNEDGVLRLFSAAETIESIEHLMEKSLKSGSIKLQRDLRKGIKKLVEKIDNNLLIIQTEDFECIPNISEIEIHSIHEYLAYDKDNESLDYDIDDIQNIYSEPEYNIFSIRDRDDRIYKQIAVSADTKQIALLQTGNMDTPATVTEKFYKFMESRNITKHPSEYKKVSIKE